MSKGHDSAEYRRNRKLLLAGSPPCALCGKPGADTVDHIEPTSRGGSSSMDNLRPAHKGCNSSRGNRLRTVYRNRW